MYPGAGTFVLIRPAQTFYERINLASKRFTSHITSAEQINRGLDVSTLAAWRCSSFGYYPCLLRRRGIHAHLHTSSFSYSSPNVYTYPGHGYPSQPHSRPITSTSTNCNGNPPFHSNHFSCADTLTYAGAPNRNVYSRRCTDYPYRYRYSNALAHTTYPHDTNGHANTRLQRGE